MSNSVLDMKSMQFNGFRVFEMELAGRPLKVETGKMAGLANGSCLVRLGDTIVIAGMGGLMIADIISRSDISLHTQLLLQPMTKAAQLRRYLVENGFAIERETYVREGKMIYVILDVRRGQSVPYSEGDIEVGMFTDSAVGREYVQRRLDLLRLRRENEAQAGRDTSGLEKRIRELEKRV